MIELRVGDSRAFFEAPFHAYRPGDGYVSPLRGDVLRMLDAKKNPLWLSGNPFRFWTAHQQGRPVGRIIAQVHGQSNARHCSGAWQRLPVRKSTSQRATA
jgi:hypothetical protein